MKISFTWPDHLIPMVAPLEDSRYMVDLFINSILLENNEPISRRLTRIILDLMYQDNPVWRMEIPIPALISHLAIDAELNSLSNESKRNLVGEYLAEHINSLQTDLTFQPGSKGLFRRFPIRFLAASIPDTLIARAFSGTHLIGRAETAIVPFVGKRPYHFPLKDIWQVVNNFDNTLGHRVYAGQEFAIDLVKLGENGMIRKGRSNDPTDYYGFGLPVEAMHDGDIISAESRLPDNPIDKSNDADLFNKHVKKFGYLSALLGNHIIIQHDKDRFSFYAHLQKDSITVKQGDRIKRGAQIANVGNSGACDYAHLHIQLNEGTNPLGSRGLPMTFTNLVNVFGQNLPFIIQNNVVVHRIENPS